MNMEDIQIGHTYEDSTGRKFTVLNKGTDCRPPGYTQPWSGVEYAQDDVPGSGRLLLSRFASCMVREVPS